MRARAEGIEAFAPAVVVVAGLTLTVAYVVALFAMMNRGVGYDVWSAVVVAPVLFGLALPALRAQAIREGDATLMPSVRERVVAAFGEVFGMSVGNHPAGRGVLGAGLHV